MNRSQWTDFIRAIKKSRGRYLSLLFIVALGTAFFTGIRSAEPDMVASADRYYDESGLMDIRIVGTLGLTADDVAAIADTDGIHQAEGGYSTEVMCTLGNGPLVINVMSECENMNQMTILEGRMPESPTECFMDAGLLVEKGYKIGDTIRLTDENGDFPENLLYDEYTIVGSGTWSWYLSWSRGAASIGDGSLDAFMVIPEEAFDMDYYTVIYALVSDVRDLNTFSDAYDSAVALVIDRIEEFSDERCQIRYSQVYEDADKILQEARDEVARGEQELMDAEQELLDAEQAYSDGLKTYEDGLKAYEDGQKAFEDGKLALEEAAKELEAGKAEYAEYLLLFQNAEMELNAGREELNQQTLYLNEQAAQVQEGWAALEAGKQQYEEQKAQFEQGQQEYEAYKAQYDDALVQLQSAEDELAAAKTELDSGWESLEEAQAQADMLKERLDQIEQEEGTNSQNYRRLYSVWTEMTTEIETQRQTLEEAQSEYDSAAATLAQEKEKLDAAGQELAAAREQLEQAQVQLAAAEEELTVREAQLVEADGQLQQGREALAEAEQQILAGEQELAAQKTLLDAAAQKLAVGEQAYRDGTTELQTVEQELQQAKQELEQAKLDLLDARQEIDDGWLEYKEAALEANQKIEDARNEIADGEKKLEELESGKWYVLGRDSVQTSVEYAMDAERIGAIGNVLPVLFFLIAALVSLTSMTRMIEEEHTLIGTMKALGYGKLSIASKYILYALSATLIGGVIGVIAGSKLLPYVIMMAYSMLYTNVQYTLTPLHPELCISAVGIAVVCTVGAAVAACYKEMMAAPASLMRPPAPKQGKRVFLEHLPFLWNRLNFSMKATIRNLIRYKKRFFMTVFGIAGCMALLLASFGLQDSVMVIADRQYKNIWTYSTVCGIDEKADILEQREFVSDLLAAQEQIESGMMARATSVDISSDVATKLVYLYVVDDADGVSPYLNLHDRITGEAYEITDDGVVMTEKLAKMLELQVGDPITIHISDTKQVQTKVTAFAENYTRHCVYMSAELYEELYGTAPLYNHLFLKLSDGTDQAAMAEELMRHELITSVSMVDDLQVALNDMINALNLVVVVLITSAGLLAFVVLFNLNSINISERRRELASLKVLGFYDSEVTMYVYRENLFLTIFGILAGLFLGTWLHQYLIDTLEVDMMMFGQTINPASYLYSILLTFGFAMIVNLFMSRDLKKIDMIESMKNVE